VSEQSRSLSQRHQLYQEPVLDSMVKSFTFAARSRPIMLFASWIYPFSTGTKASLRGRRSTAICSSASASAMVAESPVARKTWTNFVL